MRIRRVLSAVSTCAVDSILCLLSPVGRRLLLSSDIVGVGTGCVFKASSGLRLEGKEGVDRVLDELSARYQPALSAMTLVVVGWKMVLAHCMSKSLGYLLLFGSISALPSCLISYHISYLINYRRPSHVTLGVSFDHVGFCYCAFHLVLAIST